MSEGGLPTGWARYALAELGDVITGNTPQTSRRDYYGGDIPFVKPPHLRDGPVGETDQTISETGRASARVVPAGTVFVSCIGSLGKTGLSTVEAAFNQQINAVVFGAAVLPRYGLYACQTIGSYLVRVSSATTLPIVNKRKFSATTIPLAPLPEQRRIVEKIEELFSRLDAGVAALERVRANLKRYRAAVLKAAVEGKLTEQWRAQHPDTAHNVRLPQADPHRRPGRRAGRLWGSGVVPELTEAERDGKPNEWLWCKVRDLGPIPDDVVQVGPMSMKSSDFADNGVPVLNVGCVQWDRLDESKLNHLPEQRAAQFERYRIRSGDVLFTRSGTVGRCAVAEARHARWLMTFHLLRARVDPGACLPRYLRLVFEGAPHIRRQTRSASVGTTRAGFNTNLLATLDVPLPSLAEQVEIVAEVERRLSVLDEIERETEAALKRAARLRQSILKRAFEGRLVPQDPNDEPASVLLERIKAQRAAVAPSARRSRKGYNREDTRSTSGVAEERHSKGERSP